MWPPIFIGPALSASGLVLFVVQPVGRVACACFARWASIRGCDWYGQSEVVRAHGLLIDYLFSLVRAVRRSMDRTHASVDVLLAVRFFISGRPPAQFVLRRSQFSSWFVRYTVAMEFMAK